MPRRGDLESICVIGSGPIVIGQGCEFDYSGSQAIAVLRAEGYRTVVVSSNPATIMTDAEYADRTYVEPLDRRGVERVLRHERPDALLSTMGGQTALNLVRELDGSGVLTELGIEVIGAPAEVIARAEDRSRFRDLVGTLGLETASATIVTSLAQLAEVPLPAVVRPAFTLGGQGGGCADTRAQLEALCRRGLELSPIGQVIVEESLHGWDEFEFEVVRDRSDNAVVVCSIENLDPTGVHTGDSVTVAPQLTLADEAYQELRSAALAIVRAVGVDCGGANVQFARHRTSGAVRVIELNPRVSRSSALASKATGYPIAKVATRLAVGYTLDEIGSDFTGTIPAALEPALDYVVVKCPRFPFAQFPELEPQLTTRMQAVGEAMGIGRTFAEAFVKAMRSTEHDGGPALPWSALDRVPDGVHPWFVAQLAAVREALAAAGAGPLDGEQLLRLKRFGLSDRAIATAAGTSEQDVRAARGRRGIEPAWRSVDPSAGELGLRVSAAYSTWGEADDAPRAAGLRSVLVVGAGPNRIGQGMEFDYCCVRAVRAFQQLGCRSIIVNSNPSTVSTDADVSDRLYLDPIDAEAVGAICAREQPIGVCLQFGGQTALSLARSLEASGVGLLGTCVDVIDRAEDRRRFAACVDRVGLRSPAWRSIDDGAEAALAAAGELGYPVIVRPSWVLGGRAMRVCRDETTLRRHLARAGGTVFVDRFIEGAIEVDVDALCDGVGTRVCGVLRHVEPAGVHSGDSTALLGGGSLEPWQHALVTEAVQRIGAELGHVGLLNVQLALAGDELYVIEANPRASRTVPFVSKATGVDLVGAACRLLLGSTLAELELVPEEHDAGRVAVKAAVFPFSRLPGSRRRLGPEMRSTGEVMSMHEDRAVALAEARRAVDAHGGGHGLGDHDVAPGDVAAAPPRALQDWHRRAGEERGAGVPRVSRGG